MVDGFCSSLVHDILEFQLDCSSDLANYSNVCCDFSILAPSFSFPWTWNIIFFNGPDISCGETAIDTISVLTSCDPWTPAMDEDAFYPFKLQFIYDWLPANLIEDPVSHNANTLRLLFLFTSLMRTEWNPPCVMFVAIAVVASGAPAVASFFEKSLCKSVFCRGWQLVILQALLLQYFAVSELLQMLSSFT